MINYIWTDISFRLYVIWINLIILTALLIFHSYRTCYLHKNRKGSSIRLFKIISFNHLSFIVVIASMLPLLQQAIIYTPQQTISDEICKFTLVFGIIFLSFAKLALHCFVTVRSQVIHNNTTSIWFKIGLTMIISDVLYIFYIISGIPTMIAIQNRLLCTSIHVSLSVYIWFAMNDFIIGSYCLLVFILPLRKYIALEEEDKDESTITKDNNNNSELKPLIIKIMMYSSIALISTMIVTIISSIIYQSGGVLFGIDGVINSICVVLQFCSKSNDMNDVKSVEVFSAKSGVSTPPTISNNVSMVIHAMPKMKPQLKNNVSLSASLVDNQDVDVLDL